MSQVRGETAARVIWLSDPHFEKSDLVLGHDPCLRLEAAIDHINTHYSDADICLITGDMVETASPENYADLRQRLDRLALPWGPMTGNHDRRALLLKHMPLPGPAQPGFVQYVVDLEVARLICLDSLWEGEDAGELCPVRLDWLADQLEARADVPAMIFLHHPPLDLGLPMLDPDKLSNGAALLALLAQHPHVVHLCCGHVHRPVTGRNGALSYTALRAVLYQAPPPLPVWDWDTFVPAPEAPCLGVIDIANGGITIRMDEFCAYTLGGPTPSG